jgi:hypothetical protein
MLFTYVCRHLGLISFVLACAAFFVLSPFFSKAAHNIHQYSDTLSDSKPLSLSNHTFSFVPQVNIPPGSDLLFDMPNDFEILATSTFDIRNVEMYVNGTLRSSASTPTAVTDGVSITTGAGGNVRYTLNTTTGIVAGETVEVRVGNHTSGAFYYSVSYSTTTGTTTVARDTEPIRNSSSVGTHKIHLTVTGASEQLYADFHIAVVAGVSTGNVDTTEEVPPRRFNGAPTGQVGGTTLNVELSLETDELSVCKYSTASNTPYLAMSQLFGVTGQLVHSKIVPITLNSLNTYYVRCIDDEGNFNIDDYVIAFVSLPPPTGDPNSEGDVEGDGTGTGNNGTGGGSGSGGSNGGTNGGGGGAGSNSGGSGGSGGGGGGGGVGPDDDRAGGGFESADGPYRSGDAEVVIQGYAFPGSTVYGLVDGFQAVTTKAGNDGSYSMTIKEIARGVYTFGIYALDPAKVKSTTFSTSFTVSGGRTSNLSNINIMPSIKVSPDPVTPGQQLVVSGYSIPNAEVTIENQNSKSGASKKTYTATSNSSGVWSVTIDTNGFGNGTYKIRAKAKQASVPNIETNYSNYTFYGVGQAADTPLNADLNRDGKVNLTDFSILLFWWGGNGGDSDPPADINRDGKVNLTDFSILLFNWTG